jgi:hypothetical protein
MIKWPYALPNLVSACFLIGSALVVVMGLEEVSHYLISFTLKLSNLID